MGRRAGSGVSECSFRFLVQNSKVMMGESPDFAVMRFYLISESCGGILLLLKLKVEGRCHENDFSFCRATDCHDVIC